jgi:hypothetical protein
VCDDIEKRCYNVVKYVSIFESIRVFEKMRRNSKMYNGI